MAVAGHYDSTVVRRLAVSRRQKPYSCCLLMRRTQDSYLTSLDVAREALEQDEWLVIHPLKDGHGLDYIHHSPNLLERNSSAFPQLFHHQRHRIGMGGPVAEPECPSYPLARTGRLLVSVWVRRGIGDACACSYQGEADAIHRSSRWNPSYPAGLAEARCPGSSHCCFDFPSHYQHSHYQASCYCSSFHVAT
jgi:hypothetical protein